MKALFTRHLMSLRPASQAAEDMLRRTPQGEFVMVEWKRPRNLAHHRKFWLLAELVWHQVDHVKWPTVEDLVATIKILVGCRKQVYLGYGEVGYMPASISFASMDQTEFEKFYERVCDLVAEKMLPGITSAALRAEVEQLIGVAA